MKQGVIKVSIHAPARGATLNIAKISLHLERFNPRPRAGGDNVGVDLTIEQIRFNPRPRAGGDLILRVFVRKKVSFNPRPRAGGDENIVHYTPDIPVSIHAPARGATSRRPYSRQKEEGFNPRPRAGGDATMLTCADENDCVSIHAPARGATCRHILYQQRHIMFQSTPPRGGRPADGVVLLD